MFVFYYLTNQLERGNMSSIFLMSPIRWCFVYSLFHHPFLNIVIICYCFFLNVFSLLICFLSSSSTKTSPALALPQSNSDSVANVNKRVLIVEDNLVTIRILRQLLQERMGYGNVTCILCVSSVLVTICEKACAQLHVCTHNSINTRTCFFSPLVLL